jgi:hypothetical protein
MRRFFQMIVVFGLTLFVLLGCSGAAETPTATAVPPTPPPPTTEATEPGDALPEATPYDLGETTITQDRFPADSRFHNMPVRLNGLIAAPTTGTGPFPVVVIFHGTHPGCPEDETGVDRWPCAPEDEQPNYQGFDYLVSHLAAQGYVALSLNINAENTFGFGEPDAGERLLQLVELHLGALATAVAGGQNDFGVDLEGRADLQNMALVGHSRGGEAIVWLAEGIGLAAPDAYERFGYGPVRGLLLLAPAVIFTLPVAPSVPLAVLLPACDGDVIGQEGQMYYDAARLNPEQVAWALSVWLEQANHNGFNSILGPDMIGHANRPDCVPLLAPTEQQAFLLDFADDFFTAVFDPANAAAPLARMGLDAQSPAPDSLYGRAARTSTLAPSADRQQLLVPTAVGELTTHLLGGPVVAEGVTTFFCEEGHYTPFTNPGMEPCRRHNLTIPGNPALEIVSWEEAGAALRFTLPQASDLSGYAAISLRAALDPLSPLNEADAPQAFSVRLTDGAGGMAVVPTRPNEPALRFPPGEVEEEDVLEGGLFTGRVPMTTIRLMLSDFVGIDLSQVVEVALIFDQTARGSLFVTDLEWVRP